MPRPDPDSPPKIKPAGSYYYDDATGYEVYDPAQEDADEEDAEDTETASGTDSGDL